VGEREDEKNDQLQKRLVIDIGGGRTPIQFHLSRLKSNAAGVGGNRRDTFDVFGAFSQRQHLAILPEGVGGIRP